MCGVVGYIGKKSAAKILIEKLKLLQYRGYDSAGLAFQNEDGFKIIKSIGNIAQLEKQLTKEHDELSCGIGHTRWATNGEVNLQNCHPHISFDGKWAVVHNGIIENAHFIKEKYLDNVVFKSKTDTEVIAHLIASQQGNSLEKIYKALKILKGSWALAILNLDEKNKVYIAKNKSPIYFSQNENGILISSDPTCFCGESESFGALKDNEIASAQIDKIEVYDAFFNKKTYSKFKVPEFIDCEIGDHKHFMFKEIKETKKLLQKLAKIYKERELFKKINKSFFSKIEKIKIIGCGTAYNTGLIGAEYLKRELNVEVEVCVASEFRYSKPLIDKKTLCIFVSQSGETTDTIECVKLSRKKHCKIIALTNVLYSQIAILAKNILPICAGREVSVASTKAYTCGLAVFYLLSKKIRSIKMKNEKIYYDAIRNIEKLSKKIDDYDIKQIENIAKSLRGDVFFLGRGLDYFSAIEASLKLKEVSYINANAYPTGELKHGFIALIEKGTLVVVFATQKRLFDKTLNGIHEITSRGGNVLLISTKELKLDKSEEVKYFIKINKGRIKSQLLPLISIVFSQYLAYFTSVSRGINPDMPRNLAKSVTVE